MFRMVFVDWPAMPDVQKLSDGTAVLVVSITEGPQYRMGKVEIFAQKGLADKLRAEWELPEGAVFDFRYIDQYVDRNRSVLPPEFVRNDVQLVRDCRDPSVEVSLPRWTRFAKMLIADLTTAALPLPVRGLRNCWLSVPSIH